MVEDATVDEDLVSKWRTSLLAWGLLWAAIIIAPSFDNTVLMTVVWAGAFTEMGLMCAANAYRCGRLHCYFTGPLFLLGGVASLLNGLDVLPVGWDRIGIVMFVGGATLSFLPEWIWGRYAKRNA